jgi:hypothetical protein
LRFSASAIASILPTRPSGKLMEICVMPLAHMVMSLCGGYDADWLSLAPLDNRWTYAA